MPGVGRVKLPPSPSLPAAQVVVPVEGAVAAFVVEQTVPTGADPEIGTIVKAEFVSSAMEA